MLQWRWLLWLCVITVPLTEVAIIAGWWTAEIGRQPWIVWNLLRTSDAVSPSITTAQAASSLVMFVLLYSVLLVLFLFLLTARISQGPPDELKPTRPTWESCRTPSGKCSAGAGPAASGLPNRRERRRGRRGPALTLNDIWFALFVLIIAGYVILDGFDIGVGVLHLLVARTDDERRRSINSIGPIWDGNEVWLVLGAGVLFAAFPLVYASLFSGFYVAFMLVLLVMILRTVALEFRSKRVSRAWRASWDVIFSVSSVTFALLLGVALGNVLRGVTIDGSGDIHESFLDLLNPYSLAVGCTAIAMLGLHGALYLELKSEGALAERARRYGRWLTAAFAILGTVAVLDTGLGDYRASDRYTAHPLLIVVPAAAFVGMVGIWWFSSRRQAGKAFICSGAMIALLLVAGAVGIYPT